MRQRLFTQVTDGIIPQASTRFDERERQLTGTNRHGRYEMKKFGYFIITLGEILFLAAAYVIQYFTQRKMGMARYVIYKNQGWERAFPMDAFKYTAVTVLTALTLLLVTVLVLKWKQREKTVVAIHFGMIFLTALYASYTCVSSTEAMRAYYFISLMLGAAALLQMIKAAAALAVCGKKKDEK